MMIFLEITKCY